MAMGMGPSSTSELMMQGADQANNTQKVGFGQQAAIDAANKKAQAQNTTQANTNTQNSPTRFGNSQQQKLAAVNTDNEDRRNANTVQPIGMGAGTGQQKAINTSNQAMQGQGVTAVGPQVGANGKVQTGFGDTRQQQIDREIAKNAEMVVNNADAQNAGLSQSIDLMGQRSAKATEMEDPSAPVDYNAVYNTEAEIFNQKQASDWNNRMDFMAQRAKERGMEGTDLSAYLSHMELGNRMGLLDARQSIMLEGLQKDMAFKEKGYWQDRADARTDDKESYNQYMELLNASWGDEEAVRGILEMAAGTLGEDSYFANLLKNPDALRNLNDAGYNKLFQERGLAASNVLREMNDPMNMGEVNATFGAYKNAKYGSAMDVNVPSDLTIDDLDPEIYADYVAEFGEPNLENAEDVKNVYAYQQYRKDVDASFKDEIATGLVNDFLTNGGNVETAEKIRNLGSDFTFSLMEDEALSNYIGGQYNADDPINGPLSFLFSDWQGNVYADQNEYENRPQEDKNLDLLWQDYMKTAAQNGEEPISRQEFLSAALKASDFSSEEGNTFDLDEDVMSDGRKTWINDRLRESMAEEKAVQEAEVTQAEIGTEGFLQKVASMSPSEYREMWETEDNGKLTDEGFLDLTIPDIDSALSWDSSQQEFLNMGLQPGKIIQGTDGKVYKISEIGYWEDDSWGPDYGAMIMMGNVINEDGSLGERRELWRDEEGNNDFGGIEVGDGDNWKVKEWSK